MTKTQSKDKLIQDGKQDELEMKTYRQETGGFEVKEVNVENRTFRADVGAMGNVDRGDDVIEPGAFSKTISEKVPTGKVKLLDHHNRDSMQDLLGRVVEAAEVAVSGQEASHVLRALHKMSRRSSAEELLKDVEDGIADAMSIGFKPIKTEFELKEGVDEDLDPKMAWFHGMGIRRIKEAEWWESSLVIWGMNPEASPLPGTVKSFFDKLEKMEESQLEEASEKDVLFLMKSLRDTLREAEVDADILKHDELSSVTNRLGSMIDNLDREAEVDSMHTSALANVFERFREQKDDVENTPELVMWFGDELTDKFDDMDAKKVSCVECGRSTSAIVAFKGDGYNVCPHCTGVEEKADLDGARDPGDIRFDSTETSPDWSDVDLSLDAFVSAYGTEDEQGADVEELSQETKTAIAARTAKGNANADDVDGLISYPLVNPGTDNLSLPGLQAANSRAGAEDDEAVQDTVETLMSRHFDEGDDEEESAFLLVGEEKQRVVSNEKETDNDLIQRIRSELVEEFGGDDVHVWVVDTFMEENTVIYRRESDDESALFRISFEETENGEIELGEPEEVVRRTTYVPASDTEEDSLMITIDSKEISAKAMAAYIEATGGFDSEDENHAGQFVKALIDDMDTFVDKIDVDRETVKTDIEGDAAPDAERLKEYAGVLDVEPEILIEFAQTSSEKDDSADDPETLLREAGIDLTHEGTLKSLDEFISSQMDELEEDGTSQDAGGTDSDEPGSTKENDSEDGDSDEHLEEKDAVDEEARKAAGEMLEEIEGIEI